MLPLRASPAPRATAQLLAASFERLGRAAPDAWPCWSYSNHDTVRHVTRWGLSAEATKAYATLLVCLRGSVCLYQGEELGLPEASLRFEDLQDPYGIAFWPEFKGRDGARTPMPWEASNRNAGFSEGKPWLPVPPEHLALAASRQEGEGSMLDHYRRALAFRHAHACLRTGAQSTVVAEGDVARLVRLGGGEQILVVANLGEAAVEAALPPGGWTVADPVLSVPVAEGSASVTLGPWQVCLLLAPA